MKIETDRLILTAHCIADYDDYRAFWGVDDICVPGPPPLDGEESWQRLLRFIGHWASFGYGLFLIRDRATGRLVGEGGIGHFARGLGDHFDAAPEAGWKIDFHCWGRGYAREAMRAATDWFDSAYPHDRTVCMIDHDNAPSLRLAAHLGYRGYGEGRYCDEPILLFERIRPSRRPI